MIKFMLDFSLNIQVKHLETLKGTCAGLLGGSVAAANHS